MEKRLMRQLVFVHIPKTAGLSLHAALENIYGKASTLRVGNEDDLQRLRQLPNNQPIDKAFLSGHFFYNDIKNRCQPDALLISILRDPIKRILSNYNYITNWDKHPLYEQTVRQTLANMFRQIVISFGACAVDSSRASRKPTRRSKLS